MQDRDCLAGPPWALWAVVGRPLTTGSGADVHPGPDRHRMPRPGRGRPCTRPRWVLADQASSSRAIRGVSAAAGPLGHDLGTHADQQTNRQAPRSSRWPATPLRPATTKPHCPTKARSTSPHSSCGFEDRLGPWPIVPFAKELAPEHQEGDLKNCRESRGMDGQWGSNPVDVGLIRWCLSI